MTYTIDQLDAALRAIEAALAERLNPADGWGEWSRRAAAGEWPAEGQTAPAKVVS